ncbi:MAG: GNAT family N-acetyltransferase [Flavobacteriaceae bacterium]|nr:GNAT family N-acetyltransferase [Flavobacteriaceae bacterium]
MVTIREVREEDNAALAKAIRQVLIDIGVPKVGTAYADPELDFMYQAYQTTRSAYFVIEEDGVLLGGAGIAPLAGEDPKICELQKMYFLAQGRGRGLGQQMIDHCLAYAKDQNFELCYLETLPYMKAAQKLYLKTGFSYIDGPMGSTGHTSCNVWLTKAL